jgi:arylsulfatase A-like enzyme
LRPRAFSFAGKAALALSLAGCGSPPRPVDLLAAAQGPQLAETRVAGRERAWVTGQAGKQVRVNDVVRRTLPASPPSLHRFQLDIPDGARLSLAAGIPQERHDRPGVEFVVKVRHDGREDVLWTQLLDPVSRPAHRRWMPVDVDLAKYAGKGRELVLETRGFEEDADDPRRAFWAEPLVNVPKGEAPLVVVYLVDTLRADHTSPYGYRRDTTPALTAFAKDGVLFEQAIAHASWTKPSVASLLTSQLPGRHRAVQLRDTLDGGHVTLAEMLQARGFATGAAIANSVIYAADTNFEQGFDFYAGLHGPGDRPSKAVEAAGVVDAALRFVDSRRGFPTFVYVHTMDPHVPYTPPAPFDRRYEPHPAPGRAAEDPRSDYQEPADLERLVAQYDGEIAYGDQEFARFLAALKERGLYDRALVVFTADHGEEFLEHGHFTHGKTVFDELVRVPLVVKFPGRAHAGERVGQQVQLVDVVPTVLRALDLPVPEPPVIAGRPLQVVVRGGAPEPPAVSEISHRGYVAHGMRTTRDKYVRRFSPHDDELYFDLAQDPGEQTSRLDAARERVRALRGGLEQAMAANPFRHTLRVAGPGTWELRLKTGGWIEAVEPVGFGAADRYEVDGNGRKLLLRVTPRPGQPREVAFGIRPIGAPVTVEGTRNGRPLQPSDVLIAQEAVHPPAVPFPLPEIESEKERVENIFAPPPADRPGLHVWLTMIGGQKAPAAMDCETCQRLKALGYVTGECPMCP